MHEYVAYAFNKERDLVTDKTLREYLSAIAKYRWRCMSKTERTEFAAQAAKSYWTQLSPEERRAEMKRGARKREKGRKEKDARLAELERQLTEKEREKY
jgi:hypothetical protein